MSLLGCLVITEGYIVAHLATKLQKESYTISRAFMATALAILVGYLAIFLIYQTAEANGQDILSIPPKPLSIFVLFVLTIVVVAVVAYLLGLNGLAAFGLGFESNWWAYYGLGLVLGMAVQAVLERIGIYFQVRQVANFHFDAAHLIRHFLWILFANFPAATAEDLLTRGYVFHFMRDQPLIAFVTLSALLYVLNHIIRLATKPVTDWFYLPFVGLTLAYALARTGSLWLVIGLHQSINVTFYMMQQMMDVKTTTNTRRRITYGIAAELIFLLTVVLVLR